MNNGQTNPNNQSPVPPDFFTVGNGSNNPEANKSIGDNLDTSSVEWGPQSNHDTQRVGKSALYEDDLTRSTIDAEKSIPFGMPPDYIKPLVQESTLTENPIETQAQLADNGQPDVIDFDTIKTSDTLSSSGIRAIDKAEKRLEQDGKMGDFYNTARQMTEANVNNSYGDKANWKGNR